MSLNSILFYTNIILTTGSEQSIESDISFNETDTSNNGIKLFVDNSNCITFENQITTNTTFVEFYSHCDAIAGNSGQNNFISMYLKCIDIHDNTLQTIDIDTRSVQKGDQAHLSFGPSAYRIVDNTLNKPYTIHKNSKYKLYVTIGRDYEFREIKLIIKLRN